MKNLFRLTNIFLFFLICVSLFFVFALPPFQKPDEPLHFKRAFALAMGQVTCKQDIAHPRGYFSFPKNVDAFPETMMSGAIIMKPDGRFPVALVRATYPINWTHTVNLFYNCNLPFTGYGPLALGILLTVPFNNLLISFYAARFCAALFFIASIVICLRLVNQKCRLVVMLCSILPMVLQQATAVSYDSVAISMGFIIFSLFTRYIEMKRISEKNFLIFCTILILFLFTKPGYYFFALLPVFFLWSLRVSLQKKILFSASFFAIAGGVMWYSLTLPI